MESHIFSDDIGAIAVQGAVVRFDLMIQSPTEQDENGKPKLVFQQRVIMPIDSFLRAASRLNGVVSDMEKKGIITRKERSEGKSPSADKP